MRIAITLASLMLLASAAHAAELVYTPVNPTFGGSPYNSSHLLSIASTQRSATASDAKSSGATGSGSGTTNDNTTADLFVSQLQSRLLSALASQVTEAIFGDDPQDSGTITFGDTEITFDQTGNSIALTITDFTDGTVTHIEVPQLVTD
ncbi:curli assembly protein CsgF [uncultured Cohaesibacter sp.]|uniref:curli assembly protein CsgF n=1 Tax=uncultured Cohaesibacter sp. TaxID=1002546 RepID=UPI002AA88C18|nr:curli assembly protein CsgF [uncultured Cohaesibacter sp.]